ncbi:lysylphosphatidylglycerol synthase domain-containing protein [Swingsia samuiensis]|uniref:lysylphosphatidylglycerol synthase domain-containing protein n=1 Tax=Swingsia samuiensis TaxID=1293412 RepID=UPI001FE39229|nr:lysylphosphatidylglycerol synthase domain-containing protein [Swingsia samuiensis]
MKKSLPIILAVLGLTLFTFIAAKAGIHPVGNALKKVGFSGFLLLIIIQLILDLGLGLAWKAAVPQLSFFRLTSARIVRDAATACLPFSQLGGMLIGVRATISGQSPHDIYGKPITWPEAIAANLVDITTEVLGQIAFIGLALICLIGYRGSSAFIIPLILGMLFLIVGSVGFIWTQKNGGSLLRKTSSFLGHHIAADWQKIMTNNSELFQERLENLWDRPDRIALGALTHLFCWIGSAFVTWVSFLLLGAHISFLAALAIEGVVCGIMSAGFLVPGALGVQEIGYVTLGMVFGIDAQVSLSISLLRRGRDIFIGIPVLLIWQFVEITCLKHKKSLNS